MKVGDILLDEFLVEKELGGGGMGKVYLVRSQKTDRRYAVKRATSTNPEIKKRFQTELLRWINLLDHPHLSKCYFFRTSGEELYIFSEYVSTGSLRDWISKEKIDSREAALDLAIQFAWGLEAAHSQGLIHGDVKPANALVTRDGVLKVSDFGLTMLQSARASGGADDPPNVFTQAYASPEQRRGGKLSHQTDVWSWGLSVIEVFSGDLNWQHGQFAPQILDAAFQMKNERRIPLSSDVYEVLQICFAENPAKRWESMGHAADALIQCYKAESGERYSRAKPSVQKTASEDPNANRVDKAAGNWREPRRWIAEALRIATRVSIQSGPIRTVRECTHDLGRTVAVGWSGNCPTRHLVATSAATAHR